MRYGLRGAEAPLTIPHTRGQGDRRAAPARQGLCGLLSGRCLVHNAPDHRRGAAAASARLSRVADGAAGRKAPKHCPCNYLPGLLQDAAIHDLAALIAPRPLLIEAGRDDPLFPLRGVLEAYGHLERAYGLLGAAGRLARDIFPGGHQIGGGLAYDFLRRELAGGGR